MPCAEVLMLPTEDVGGERCQVLCIACYVAPGCLWAFMPSSCLHAYCTEILCSWRRSSRHWLPPGWAANCVLSGAAPDAGPWVTASRSVLLCMQAVGHSQQLQCQSQQPHARGEM